MSQNEKVISSQMSSQIFCIWIGPLDDDARDLDLCDVLLLSDGVEKLAARGQLRYQGHLVARVVHVDQPGGGDYLQGCQVEVKNGLIGKKLMFGLYKNPDIAKVGIFYRLW